MIISFFEEFPSSSVLKKAESIKFPFNLYLADYSLDSFKLYIKEIKNTNLKKAVWWPLLHKNDSYWISAFSRTVALQRLFKTLDNQKIAVMLDLEYPKKRSLILKNIFKLKKNKVIIQNFIKNYKGEVYTCEYYPDSFISKRFERFFGLDINPREYNTSQIRMFYSSMHRFNDSFLEEHFKKNVSELKNRFIVGLGTIARGINGNEPILTPAELAHDLELCKNCNVSEVIIYQLEGLNTEYLKVIERFA